MTSKTVGENENAEGRKVFRNGANIQLRNCTGEGKITPYMVGLDNNNNKI